MSLDLRLAVTDQPVGTVPIKIKCPDRIHKARVQQTDKNNSLAVYDDHIHCYGCNYNRQGKWGLADLLEVSVDEARGMLEKYDSDTLDAYRERAALEARTDPLPSSLAEVYHRMLYLPARRDRRAWLYARGLTLETIDLFKIGHDGNRFVIPLFDKDMNLLTLRFRRDDEYLDDKLPKYTGVKGRNGLYVFGEWLVPSDAGVLFLTEGELDAIRLTQEGLVAVSATNGAGQVHKLPQMIRDRWPLVHTLYIATDMDEAGQEAARLTKQTAESLGFQTRRVEWSGEAKDVTDAIQFGFLDPQRLVA